MRYRNGIISAVMLVLGTITLGGMASTAQYAQVARVESVGFDALAHELFSGGAVVCADERQTMAQR
jgi:hypothetical protein